MRIYIQITLTFILVVFYGPLPLLSQSIYDVFGVKKFTGNVESIKMELHSAKENFGDIDTDKLIYRLNTKYNKVGNPIEVIAINEYSAFQMQFDDNGNLKEFLWDFSYNDQIPRNKLKYSYDHFGLSSVDYYSYDEPIKEGYNIIRVAKDYIEKDGYVLRTNILYVKDENGLIIREDVQQSQNGGPCNILSNPYGEYYYAVNEIRDWSIGSYNSMDNPNEALDYEYRKDENNIFTEKVGQYIGGSYSEIDFLKYNKRREYEYDQYGNWVKCIFFIHETPTKILERKIKYFLD